MGLTVPVSGLLSKFENALVANASNAAMPIMSSQRCAEKGFVIEKGCLVLIRTDAGKKILRSKMKNGLCITMHEISYIRCNMFFCRFIILLLTFFSTASVTFSQTCSIAHKLEIPTRKPGEKVIIHEGYCLSFNERHKQANWVAYELTDSETISVFTRSNRFMPDPNVATGTATDNDYSHSGYDRGHLAPAADMGWSETAMKESFYYSNMSPQLPGFNRGIWKRTEELVRNWAVEYQAVYVVTGPVLTTGLHAIGANHVSVPRYFYKVVLDKHTPAKGVGFVISNQSSTAALQSFAVSIDSVEKLTGIDFFPLLADSIENRVESRVNINEWNWHTGASHSPGRSILSGEAKAASKAVQCAGITKRGIQCRNMTTNKSGFCHLHSP